MTPRERGDRAKQLLADEVLTQAQADIREAIVKQLEGPEMDFDAAWQLVLLLKSGRQMRMRLERYAQEVAIDKHRLKHDSFIKRMRQGLSQG